jgi:hypothetical protein
LTLEDGILDDGTLVEIDSFQILGFPIDTDGIHDERIPGKIDESSEIFDVENIYLSSFGFPDPSVEFPDPSFQFRFPVPLVFSSILCIV